MSYDIFCYRSTLGRPDQDEADAVIEADTDRWAKRESNASVKLALVKALKEYDPGLSAFDFQYSDISLLTVEALEKEKGRFTRIEMSSQEDAPQIQLSIYDNHVYIMISYIYKGELARRALDTIRTYIDIIHATAGYFVSDPQTGNVFDPGSTPFDGLAKYLSVTDPKSR
jgi:hypothetical protein